MSQRLQIIEPTLDGFAGHCYSLVASLCRALGRQADIWAAKGAESLDFGQGITIHPVFRRRTRVLQQLMLYRRLLRSGDPLVITTARRTDLISLKLVAPGTLPENRVFLYFHWFRESPKRLQFLQKIAKRQPNLVIFGTTSSVAEYFRRAGFRFAEVLPYPAPGPASIDAGGFRRLLYAGAARRDKGFNVVVDLVALLKARQERIPVAVQISPEHFGKYDTATLEDIDRLQKIGYPHLQVIDQTLDPETYLGLFPGSICLQPYDRQEFHDRVSGVTLDALSQGCPVITTAHTWMAAQVLPPRAGLALEQVSAPALYDAVRELISRYDEFRDAALEAGRTRERETWSGLTRRLR